MERKTQTLAEILDRLSPLPTEWEDETATKTIAKIEAIPSKASYGVADIESLLDADFKLGILVARLFLGLSDDDMETSLKEALGVGGTGVKRYGSDRANFLSTLVGLGLLDAMAETVNRPLAWSDILVERLRSGRGKAVRGQKRGRNLERWKAEANEIFDRLDLQGIAKALELLPGQDVSSNVLPGLHRLRNEIHYLQGQLDYTRMWRGLGIGSVHYFVIPDRRTIGIPMSQEHCKELLDFVDRLRKWKWDGAVNDKMLCDFIAAADPGVSQAISHGPNENAMLSRLLEEFRPLPGSAWERGE